MSKEAKFKCIMCGYEWKPRVDEPKECPNCKTRYWREQDE